MDIHGVVVAANVKKNLRECPMSNIEKATLDIGCTTGMSNVQSHITLLSFGSSVWYTSERHKITIYRLIWG